MTGSAVSRRCAEVEVQVDAAGHGRAIGPVKPPATGAGGYLDGDTVRAGPPGHPSSECPPTRIRRHRIVQAAGSSIAGENGGAGQVPAGPILGQPRGLVAGEFEPSPDRRYIGHVVPPALNYLLDCDPCAANTATARSLGCSRFLRCAWLNWMHISNPVRPRRRAAITS